MKAISTIITMMLVLIPALVIAQVGGQSTVIIEKPTVVIKKVAKTGPCYGKFSYLRCGHFSVLPTFGSLYQSNGLNASSSAGLEFSFNYPRIKIIDQYFAVDVRAVYLQYQMQYLSLPQGMGNPGPQGMNVPDTPRGWEIKEDLLDIDAHFSYVLTVIPWLYIYGGVGYKFWMADCEQFDTNVNGISLKVKAVLNLGDIIPVLFPSYPKLVYRFNFEAFYAFAYDFDQDDFVESINGDAEYMHEYGFSVNFRFYGKWFAHLTFRHQSLAFVTHVTREYHNWAIGIQRNF